MSARRSPVEHDARRYAAIHLRVQRQGRRDRKALELLDAAADSLARVTAQYVLSGNMPEARRNAAAHQLLADSAARLSARKSRELDAENERRAAAHGITTGTVVRTTRMSAKVDAGVVCTIGDVSGNILWTTIDGESRIVWAEDVERVEPPMPHDVVERAEQRLMDQGYADDEDMVELPMPHDDEYDAGPPEPEGAEVFECDRDGCDYAIGAVGIPAFDDDPDVFNDEIQEHIRGHRRDDAAVPA